MDGLSVEVQSSAFLGNKLGAGHQPKRQQIPMMYCFIMFISVFLFLLLLCFFIVGASVSSWCGIKDASIAEVVVVGFQVLTVGASLIVLITPARVDFPPFLLLVAPTALIIFCCRATVVSSLCRYGRGLSLLMICAGAWFALVFLGVTTLRFHSSPDNHGFISAISYVYDHPSLSYLQSDFMQESGASIPAHLGQKTSLLVSTWNVSDARLRFTSDMVLTVGRIGLPAVIASWIGLSRSADMFGMSIFLVSLIGLVAISTGITRSAFELYRFTIPNDHESRYEKQMFSLTAIFIAVAPIFVVMTYEGQATQLWMLGVSVSQIGLQLQYVRRRRNFGWRSRAAQLCLGPVFLALVYPHGLLVCGLVVTQGLLLEWVFLPRGRKRSFVPVIPYIVLGVVVAFVLFRTTRYSFIPMLRQFASGVSGAPYNLGYLSPLDAFAWIGSSVRFTDANGPGEAFGVVPSSIPSVSSFVVLLGVAIGVLFVTSFRISRQNGIVVCLMAGLIVLSCLPLWASIVKDPAELNPYIYARNLSLALVFVLIPIVAAAPAVYQRVERLGVVRYSRVAVSFVLVLGFLAQVTTFVVRTKEFQNASRPLAIAISGSTVDAVRRDASVFVSDTPQHVFFLLTAFGKFRYLTDNWNPRLIIDSSTAGRSLYQVYYLEKTQFPIEGIESALIGELRVEQSLDGPIGVNDLEKLEGFRPNRHFLEMLAQLSK